LLPDAFLDGGVECRQHIALASGHRRDRRIFVDLSMLRRLPFERYAISAEMF
jgi:hypothetical protein